jgi:hypothetical protein
MNEDKKGGQASAKKTVDLSDSLVASLWPLQQLLILLPLASLQATANHSYGSPLSDFCY